VRKQATGDTALYYAVQVARDSITGTCRSKLNCIICRRIARLAPSATYGSCQVQSIVQHQSHND
jgi:hypothetical protein